VLRRLQLFENNMAHVALQQFIPLCEAYKTQESNGTFAETNSMEEIPSLWIFQPEVQGMHGSAAVDRANAARRLGI
jgi:hypothetical protein